MICTWLHPIFKAQQATLIAIKTRKSRMAQGQSTSEFANFNAYAAIEEADQFWRSWKIKLRGLRVDLKRLFFKCMFLDFDWDWRSLWNQRDDNLWKPPNTSLQHPPASGWKKKNCKSRIHSFHRLQRCHSFPPLPSGHVPHQVLILVQLPFSFPQNSPIHLKLAEETRNPEENTGKIKHVEPSGMTRMLPSGVISALQVA